MTRFVVPPRPPREQRLLRVLCEKNGGHCVYFTDGQIYDAHQDPYGTGRLYDLVDDRGDVRTIIPEERTPHIKDGFRVVGIFRIVP